MMVLTEAHHKSSVMVADKCYSIVFEFPWRSIEWDLPYRYIVQVSDEENGIVEASEGKLVLTANHYHKASIELIQSKLNQFFGLKVQTSAIYGESA